MTTTAPTPLSPARPQYAACVAWLRELLEADRRSGIVRDGPEGPVVRWNLIAPDYDRSLGREAWEALVARGLLPDSWPGDTRRAFRLRRDSTCPRCEGSGQVSFRDRNRELREWRCGTCAGEGNVPGERIITRWESVRAALTFASDAPGIASAEALAREAAERLRPWGVPWPAVLDPTTRAVTPAADLIVWRVLGDGEPEVLLRRGSSEIAPQLDRVLRAGRGYMNWASETLLALPARAVAEGCARSRYAWRTLAASDAEVPARSVGGSLPAFVPVGRKFAELPDPFEPLCALWEMGYALEDIRADGIFLLAPAFDRASE